MFSRNILDSKFLPILAKRFFMRLITLLFLTIFLSLNGMGMTSDTNEVKARHLEYADFIANYSVNDTSSTIIYLYFDKKDNGAKSQMVFLPITAGIFLIFPPVGAGLSVVSIPLFINGTVMLIKYRKKNLLRILQQYKADRSLPNWLRKKVNKSLDYERFNYE